MTKPSNAATPKEWTEEDEAAFQAKQRERAEAMAAKRAAEHEARLETLKDVLPALVEDKPVKLSHLEEALRALPTEALPRIHVDYFLSAAARVRSSAQAVVDAAEAPPPVLPV